MFRPITPPDWDLDRLKLEDADQLGYGGILR